MPDAVVNDFAFLYTQPEDACRSGLVEAVKVALVKEKGFPLDWPALEGWARLFQFSNGKSFTGCAVVSADRC